MLPQTIADDDLGDVFTTIERYYTRRVAKYGATPRGVDWTCRPTQELRFVQLLKLCSFTRNFSLNDVGCGYGALIAYLAARHPDATVDYLGVDLSPAMIRAATRLWRGRAGAKFVVANAIPRTADYSVASGIFNVKLDQSLQRWETFIATTLADMRATARRGFAVNFMAPLPPNEPTQVELYRTAPEPWVRYCEHTLGSSVDLLAGYGLREFTLLVRHRF
jgi:SAM-dependent methyltransferase